MTFVQADREEQKCRHLCAQRCTGIPFGKIYSVPYLKGIKRGPEWMFWSPSNCVLMNVSLFMVWPGNSWIVKQSKEHHKITYVRKCMFNASVIGLTAIDSLRYLHFQNALESLMLLSFAYVSMNFYQKKYYWFKHLCWILIQWFFFVSLYCEAKNTVSFLTFRTNLNQV